ncbi:hemerythrin domain-containing protein [Massilia terrae]|uniref:Hemerythrin domain-containing protein n=1 Tax=Massilia terrae TaxID=1811224 RepID=A0ABT2D0B5_9BURK|nr:hemerythrin domain-containing protein [Massilia terrae]MCS0659673.1 hemerythrin domain-containing protein [Massilia terrae]
MAIFDDPVQPSHPMDPVEHPLDLLLRDHEMVRKLADKYCNTDDKAVKKQAATQLVQAIHTHSRVEESVFYPGVRQIDAAMIGHFEQDHQKVDDLIAALQGMKLDEQQADRLMMELIPAVLHHIEQEEKEFFPKLERANMDMAPIGLQMQSFEANLIHMQAQAGIDMRR